MANDEHVALLKQGASAWNAWRDENPDIPPDLSRADLRRADLKRVDLRRVDLIEADLVWADLSGADVRLADLRMANLVRANFSGADLRGRASRVPPWWTRTLRVLTSPAVASSVYPHGV
jgi:hypothetical protein